MSAQSDHQNGRPLCSPVQSNVPVNFLSPSDPRLKNLSQSGEVCRNYVWGICKKQGQCKFRHNCTIEEMKTIIRFCHDHQNRKEGCSRPDCSFLHTSSEEEDLFLTTGKIPKILIERYAAISNTNVTPPNGSTLRHLESSPSMYVARPPPPPPPLSTVTGPPPPPPTWPVPVLPPPPPPTEPSTLRAVPTAALFTAPVSNTILKINQPPPPLPPNFDARRPPPPLPAGLINGALKRPLDSCDAGPSKLRKTDDLDDPDTPCELCAQRELSLKLCSEKLQKIITQKECKKLLLKTKKEESESFRAMLGLLVPAEICAAVEEYIEGDYSTTLGLSMETSSMQELLLGYLLDKVHTDVVKENTSRSVSVTSCSRYVSGQRPGGDGQSRPPVPCAEPTPLYPPPFRPDVPPPTVRPPYPTMATPVPPVMQPVCTPTPAPYASVPRAALPPLMPAVPSTTLPSVPPSVPLNGHSYSQFIMGYHSPHYPPPQ